MTRRKFLLGCGSVSFGILASAAWSRSWAGAGTDATAAFKGADVFDRILKKAEAEHWAALPINDCMARIALELEGTPYVGFTLELSKDHEVCAVNLTGLDCV